MSETPAWGTPPEREEPTDSSPTRIIRPPSEKQRWHRPKWWDRGLARHEAELERDVDEGLLPLVHPTVGVAVPRGAELFDLSRGGRFLATCSEGSSSWTTRVWDLEGGRLVWVGTSDQPVDAVLVDDDMTLVTSRGGKLFWYDLWGGDWRSRKLHGLGPVSTLAFHPAGRHVVAGTPDGTVALVPLTSTERPSKVGRLRGAVSALAVDAEGSRIVAGGAKGDIRVWDVRVKGPVLEVEDPARAALNAVSFRKDASQVETVGADATCRRWHIGSTQLVSTFTVPGGQPLAVDGRADAVAVVDREHGLAFWDQVTGKPTARLARGRGIKAIRSRAGGTGLAGVTANHTVWIWPWPSHDGRPE